MEYTGYYKIDLIHTLVPKGEEFEEGFDEAWLDKDAYIALADPNDPHDLRERMQMFEMLLKVDEDGNCYTLFPIPEDTPKEEIEKAVAQGAKIVDNKFVIMDEGTPWELRDGEFYTRSGVEGEFLGQESDPWVKSGREDGSIILGSLVEVKYVRVDR